MNQRTDSSPTSKTKRNDLDELLAPSSVALVGATPNISKFGGKVFHNLVNFGFEGEIYPINPKYTEIQGRKCYPSLDSVPGVVDHVGIVVPTPAVSGVLQQCGSNGVRAATIFTSGFAEGGSKSDQLVQAELKDVAQESGVRFLGPNCNGLVNHLDGFALTSSSTARTGRLRGGPIGIVAHSGGLGLVNGMWRMQKMSLGVGYAVTCGNQGDVAAVDIARHMIQDERITVVLAVLETLSDGLRWRSLAREAARVRKPIVVLRIGRTEAGKRAAASHSGAIIGSSQASEAAFKQWGMVLTDDFAEALNAVQILQGGRIPDGTGNAAVSLSGGNIAMLADMASEEGLVFPPYTPGTQDRIGHFLPDFGHVANPTDVTAAADNEVPTTEGGDHSTVSGFSKVLAEAAKDDHIDVVIPLLTLAPREHVESVLSIYSQSAKPVVVLWTGGSRDPSVDSRTLIEAGVPTFDDTRACAVALSHLHRYADFLRNMGSEPDRCAVEGTNGQLRAAIASGRTGSLDEVTSKAILGEAGIPVVKEVAANTLNACVAAAEAIEFPVALKLMIPGLTHKTELGGVRLNLKNRDEVATAYDELSRVAAANPGTTGSWSVVVQQFISPGIEMIVGSRRDVAFGQVVMVGIGGVHAEVIGDASFRIAPVTQREAKEMIDELRCLPLLTGFRGSRPYDVAALAKLVANFSEFCAAHDDEIEEVDINPLLLSSDSGRFTAVDSLIVLRDLP